MMTIDHLRVDHRITVIRKFADAQGTIMHVGDAGIIRDMRWDQLRDEITIRIERDSAERVELLFALNAQTGPRNGHMREYFAVAEYAPIAPRNRPAPPEATEREMIMPAVATTPVDPLAEWRALRNTEGPDHQEAAEKALLAEINHIGVASSIAEMYAQRMRAFQAEGNEARAIAAFKLADQWMWTYASWATSGGEGAALSYERKQFRAALVKEFGYDPAPEDK